MRILCSILVASWLLAAPVAGQPATAFGDLNLSKWGARDLLIERRALMVALSAPAVADQGPLEKAARAGIYLDLAELHFAQMLRAEASDYLLAIEPEDLDAPSLARYHSIRLSLDLLGYDADLGSAIAQSEGWSQGVALRVAAMARMDMDVAEELPAAVAGLPSLSDAIAAAILPDLLETALTADNWDAAKELASYFSDHPELRDSAAYRFLLARASELSGDLLMAFDGYAEAAEGRDVYAHRARLAIVELGLRTETLPMEDAVALLKTARWSWSGDGFAKRGTALLAQYAADLGDMQAALWALQRVMTTADGPAEAEQARQHALSVISDFYRAGAAGDVSLDAFLDGHGAIMTRWGLEEGVVESAFALPQSLLDTGMTALAAREFQGLRAVAESADSMGQSVLDPALINRLRRNEAEALLAGGQADAAVDLLISFGDQQEADPRMKRLLIQALSKAGRSDELAELRVLALDIDSRRGRAVALYESGNWGVAQQALDGLWKTYPAQFTFADATRLTLAAYQMGDMATVRRTATAFPSLTDLPGWEELATGLLEGAPDAALLSTGMMRLSMDNADRVLNTVTEVREGLADQ
jgi:hypothetical protein